MLGNLGLPKWTPSGIWAGTMVALEICIRVSVSIIGESR